MSNDDQLLRLVLVIGAALLLLPVVLMLVMMPTFGGMHTGAWDGGMMGTGGWWLVSGLLPLVVVAVLAYAGYRVLAGGEETDRAIEELRQAYARGELSDDEYETRIQRLKEDAE
ncbi:SHOCT domain-containing protein [Natronomonas amylolytica]|uniref:SHOCT domain-containing protein n=1 Tax=Natronomonas amylolytica TaxID=3108498 RepID=UPI00300971F8